MIADHVAADAAALGRDAYVMIVCFSVDVESLRDRVGGFLEQAATHPNIHFVEERREGSIDGILNTTLEGLLVNEQVNTVFSAFDIPTIAAASATAQLGRDEVRIYGIDHDEPILRMLQEGRVHGIHVQWAQPQASLCLFTLLRVINGDVFETEVWEPDIHCSRFCEI
jgi:ABC-type sugar transport system substrate-binding protein